MNWPLSIGDDAGGFLAAMLQGMQPQNRQGAGIGMAVNAENAAFLMQGIGVEDRRSKSFMALPRRFEQGV